jgi:PPM family protein phosphatase
MSQSLGEQMTHLQWSGWTDRGRVRPTNEDAFLGLQFDAREVCYLGKFGQASTQESDYVFAVSDGMGGAMAGEFASRITVEKVTRLLPRSYRHGVTGMNPGFEDVLLELFDQIHRALTFLGGSYEECSGMGATLSLCWFTPGWMYFGHVGDTRIYYLSAREGSVRQITQDDTYVGWLFRNGKLNERQARTHPRKSVLQQSLGAGNQFINPQLGAVAYEPGDRFLLCSDGVVDAFFDSHLHDWLRSPEGDSAASAQRLVESASQQSGRDNATALVISVV